MGGLGGRHPSGIPRPCSHSLRVSPRQEMVPAPLHLGLQLLVKGCSLRKRQPAQHQSQDKHHTATPRAPQPAVPCRRQGRATQVPQPGAVLGKPAPLGQRSRRCPSSSAPLVPPQPPGCCARSQGQPQLGRGLRQPQTPLPQLADRPLARALRLLSQDGPGSPWAPGSQPPSSPSDRVPHLPELAPSCRAVGQPSAIAGRGRRAALGRRQKICDAERHPGDSTLPVPATQRHPAPPRHSWAPSAGGVTQPTHRRGCKTPL